MPKRVAQLPLDLPPRFEWGGARFHAGRRPVGEEPGISHRRTIDVDHRVPVHVTVRVHAHVWNLRGRRCHQVIAAALRAVLDRPDFRTVHFSIQGTHFHLVVEADDARALAGGMKALLARIGLGLNALMGRHGPVFRDRYHAHVLRTPSEVHRAVSYVVGNLASHALRRGERLPPGFVDPCSPAAERRPDGKAPSVSEPRSWLLRSRGLSAKEPEAEYAAAA